MGRDLEADYVVVGAGAMGMAFVDVLLAETDARIVLIDRHGRPGGHWNDAYPFVRLHQPSAFYGVNSRELGSGTRDETGWNRGLYELASGAEVCAYFDRVLRQQFLPSGRVQYFPMCDHLGEGRFRSRVTGEEQRARAGRRLVDATYMNVTVPSQRPPPWEVAPQMRCVPLNALPRCERPADGWVVVGAGKTGMDACLWLLENGADPDAIRWIRPRDSWLLDRANIQPGTEFFDHTVVGALRQNEAIAGAASIDALFERVHAAGQLLRLDDDVRPSMYRCATVTRAELEQLRRIRGVVRQGRVRRIERDRIVLDAGSIPTSADTLHVDCSADGLERRPVAPVFDGARITLQTVRTCQQVFSAAFIAHVEAAYDDDATRNRLCRVVPHPDSDLDFLRTTLGNTLNQIEWGQDPDLQAWLRGARLDVFSHIAPDVAKLSAEQQAVLARLLATTPEVVATLQKLLADVDG